MLNHVVGTHHGAQRRAQSLGLGLEDVGEHLQVIAAGTESLADYAIDVAALVIDGKGQADLRQQLVVRVLLRSDEFREEGVVGLYAPHVDIQVKAGFRVIVYLHLGIVVAQS